MDIRTPFDKINFFECVILPFVSLHSNLMTKRKSDLDLSPVFIGIGDFVDKNNLEKSLNPLELFSLTQEKP